MKTSELLRATRKRFDARVLELRERNERMRRIDAAAELEVIDPGRVLEGSLYDAGGIGGTSAAEELLESITSPLWREAMRLFEQLGPEPTTEEWKTWREASLRAQREGPFRQWCEAPGRSVADVHKLLSSAVAVAVKQERENG